MRIVKRNEIHGSLAVKIKLSIDARWLVGGIGTYTRQLLAGLAEAGNEFEVQAIVRRRDADAVARWCERVTVVDTQIYTLREQLDISRAASGCDLLHVPHYNAPLLHRGPLLVSIHDLIHITDACFKHTLKARAYAAPVLRLAARRAAHIVTVSEYSKAQIVARLGVPASKVTTIHNGVDESFHYMPQDVAFQAVSQFTGFQEPYFLYVGSLKPYKNVSILLQAYALVRSRRRTKQKLLIVGDDPRWKKPLLQQQSLLGLDEDVLFLSHVPSDLLPKVYAAAGALIMPSRIEGFGLPVLEAMACGTPVICSRAASLPEVGGDAVLYFDPSNPEDLAAAIERLLESVELQSYLRARGLERAGQFTIRNSVRKHVELYRQLLAAN